MKIKNLISELQQLDPNAEVSISDDVALVVCNPFAHYYYIDGEDLVKESDAN